MSVQHVYDRVFVHDYGPHGAQTCYGSQCVSELIGALSVNQMAQIWNEINKGGKMGMQHLVSSLKYEASEIFLYGNVETTRKEVVRDLFGTDSFGATTSKY